MKFFALILDAQLQLSSAEPDRKTTIAFIGSIIAFNRSIKTRRKPVMTLSRATNTFMEPVITLNRRTNTRHSPVITLNRFVNTFSGSAMTLIRPIVTFIGFAFTFIRPARTIIDPAFTFIRAAMTFNIALISAGSLALCPIGHAGQTLRPAPTIDKPGLTLHIAA